jgi:hypothetical protein
LVAKLKMGWSMRKFAIPVMLLAFNATTFEVCLRMLRALVEVFGRAITAAQSTPNKSQIHAKFT